MILFIQININSDEPVVKSDNFQMQKKIIYFYLNI